MRKEKFEELVNGMVEFIKSHEGKKGEESLFTLSIAMKSRLKTEFGVKDLEEQRKISITAYNLTHPKTPYEYKPLS